MDVCRELGDRLGSRTEVLFAFLFGSRAEGRPHPGSDLDVAVFLDETLDASHRFAFRRHLTAELEDLGSPDVVILNDAPPLLAQRALQGKRIHVRSPEAFVRFFVRTEAEAGDEAYFRALHAGERERRLAEGAFGRP